jgi:predicted acyltransferase
MSVQPVGRAGERLLSLDAYRGFTMLAMATGGLALAELSQNHPDSQLWSFLGRHSEHVEWRGCSFWDLIQPSFMFIVGVAMPFSYARRRDDGQSWGRMFGHALMRSVVLVLLAIFLSSAGKRQTEFIFTNVLAQIGLGYMVVFLLLDRSPRVQFLSACAISIGYWLWFALSWPPGPNAEVATTLSNDPAVRLTGFLAHWSKNANPAAAFDQYFLNLFPRPANAPFRFNEGGYTTLNFVPSIATMIFGVLAGEFLRSVRPAREKIQGLLVMAALCLVIGTAMDGTVCPIVKRIWTPSWVVYSTGWTLGMLAAFYAVIDVAGYRRWAFPFFVVGANSIAIYVMAQLLKPFVARTLLTHVGPHIFDGEYGPVVRGAAVTLALWLVCLWMYQRKIFIRI